MRRTIKRRGFRPRRFVVSERKRFQCCTTGVSAVRQVSLPCDSFQCLTAGDTGAFAAEWRPKCVAPFEGAAMPVHKSNLVPWILEESPGQSLSRPTCARLVSDLCPNPVNLVSDLSPQGWLQRMACARDQVLAQSALENPIPSARPQDLDGH